jgi:thiamine monophosphate synthase
MLTLSFDDCRFRPELEDVDLKLARYIHPKFRLIGLSTEERKEAIAMVKVSIQYT